MRQKQRPLFISQKLQLPLGLSIRLYLFPKPFYGPYFTNMEAFGTSNFKNKIDTALEYAIVDLKPHTA